MRVTSSMYYNNLFETNGMKLTNNLFDVNKQIASGLKIQYANEDVTTFVQTMQLDNEMTTLGQIKKSTESGLKVSTQTDVVLNEFDTSLDKMKTLLINAANGTQSQTSLDAIADEMRGLEEHFKNLANTSINGQFIFSGSAVNTKPISADGIYHGNDGTMNAFLGAQTQQQYNMSGAELFLGEEVLIKREVTSNVVNENLSAKYPDFTDPSVEGISKYITPSDTIRDLMGSVDATSANNYHFYLRGTQSDGTAFNEHIVMHDGEKVDELLTKIGEAYGNTVNLQVVNVSMNSSGQIVIEDKMKGSSKLDFHLVGSVDFDLTDKGDMANIDDPIYGVTAGTIDNLAAGETNFNNIMYDGASSAANPKLYVKSFVQSDYTVAPSTEKLISAEYTQTTPIVATDIYSITINNGDGTTTLYGGTAAQLQTDLLADNNFTVDLSDPNSIKLNTTQQGVDNGVFIQTSLENITTGSLPTQTLQKSAVPTGDSPLVYDRTQFTQDGSKLSSNVSQILKDTNAFATPSTKISQVADLSQEKAGTLDGTQLKLVGTTIDGLKFDLQIDLNSNVLPSTGSTFSLDKGVTNFSIFDMSAPTRQAVNADDMTYQQLMDVVNMAMTKNLPPPDISGVLHFHPDTTPFTAAEEYDTSIKNSKAFAQTTLSSDGKLQFVDTTSTNTKATLALFDANSGKFGGDSSVMSFNANNALTVRDPKTDFFQMIDEMITAVENYKTQPDASSGDARNVGIQNAIKMIDDLQNHVQRSHSKVGAQSNTLTNSLDRTQILELSTMSLRSSVIDTDLAEASMNLAKLSLNYEAMLSTVGKVSKLSLVNYL